MTKSLAARDDFVLFLFTLMTNKKTFLQTATLIEDILGVKKVRAVFTISLYYDPKGQIEMAHSLVRLNLCFSGDDPVGGDPQSVQSGPEL